MSKSVLDTIISARAVSVPLVAVSTADQGATVEAIAKGTPEKAAKVRWDAVRGLVGLNQAGKAVLTNLDVDDTRDNLPKALSEATLRLPQGAILFVLNAHRFCGDPVVSTAIGIVRDAFKVNARMALLLGPSFDLPAETTADVLLLDEPVPNDAALGDIVDHIHKAARVNSPSLPLPSDTERSRAITACRGLNAFMAEQSVAMALTETGMDLEALWELKRTAINAVPGLTLITDGPSYADIGGNAAIINYCERLQPSAILWIDEIDKEFAGLGVEGGPGDNTGVTQYALKETLTWMDGGGKRKRASGMILVGLGGTGKSMFAQAVAISKTIPLLVLNIGETKSPHVGESEAAIRNAYKVIDGIGGGNTLVIATCNKMTVLPPELQRRFTKHTWYFDLPTRAEKDRIWALNLASHPWLYGQVNAGAEAFIDAATGKALLPDDTDWTGAEIRNCCADADERQVPLVEAGRYVIPRAHSDARVLADLRGIANGRWLSTSYEGPYRRDEDEELRARQIDLATSQPRLVGLIGLVAQDVPAPTAGVTVPKTHKGES